MTLHIEKASGIGFCFGVKRAIEILENAAGEYGTVETLGAAVHNQPVLRRLAEIGVTIADSVDSIKGNRVALGAHGVSPEIEAKLRERHIDTIDTTCPFVHRAQIAAQGLARDGFFTVIYGDIDHVEIKGVLGWAKSQGIAALDTRFIEDFESIPRRLGILSQTTQIPEHFNAFVKSVVDTAMGKDSEIRIIDTICHDIRQRQAAALELAHRVDTMLIIGGHSSANTNHLVGLCSKVARTYLVETADEIEPSWFEDHRCIGIASGASTDEQTIDEVISKLESLT